MIIFYFVFLNLDAVQNLNSNKKEGLLGIDSYYHKYDPVAVIDSLV